LAPTKKPSFAEFVCLIALMMAVTAFSIDNLLPAFDVIRREFSLKNDNDAQLLVYTYLIAFSLAQMIYGPISDMVGRRPVLIGGMAIFVAGSLLAIVATSFEMLLIARVIQGIGSAAGRALAVAIVRDLYKGSDMARVMSLAMMAFLIAPVIAPAVGSLLLAVGTWHLIFGAMLLIGVTMCIWFALRMPETLHPEYRMPPSAARIGRAIVTTMTTRQSIGYSTAVGLLLGCVMGYVGSAQQILETTVYGLGPAFSLYFAAIAAVQAAAALVNSRFVRRIGMRRLAHFGVCGFAIAGFLMMLAALLTGGKPPFPIFILLLAACFFLFGLTVPNFNAMSMEPLGAIAGTAASFLGTYTSLMGAVIGLGIGRAFDGTITPLSIAVAVLGCLCVAVVLWSERGRLFRASPQAGG
jgi:DHA1 family bicyclomycin/chloramphenicol resistance-like MFS transporter